MTHKSIQDNCDRLTIFLQEPRITVGQDKVENISPEEWLNNYVRILDVYDYPNLGVIIINDLNDYTELMSFSASRFEFRAKSTMLLHSYAVEKFKHLMPEAHVMVRKYFRFVYHGIDFEVSYKPLQANAK